MNNPISSTPITSLRQFVGALSWSNKEQFACKKGEIYKATWQTKLVFAISPEKRLINDIKVAQKLLELKEHGSSFSWFGKEIPEGINQLASSKSIIKWSELAKKVSQGVVDLRKQSGHSKLIYRSDSGALYPLQFSCAKQLLAF